MSKNRKQKMITPEIMRQAVVGAFTKLDPRYMMKNPVMFVVEIGFVISLVLSFAPGLLGDTTPNARVYNSIVSADIRQRRVALALGPEAYAQADDEQDAHGGKNAASLAAVDGRGKAAARTQAACPLHAVRRFLPAGVHHFTEGDDACAGQEHHGIQLDQV